MRVLSPSWGTFSASRCGGPGRILSINLYDKLGLQVISSCVAVNRFLRVRALISGVSDYPGDVGAEREEGGT